MNMPMPMPKIQSSGESSGDADSQAPFAEDPAVNPAGSDVELDTPSHDEAFPKPSIDTFETKVQTSIVMPQAPAKGIEVVAIRKGFYNQNRIKEGDRFFIRDDKDFGEWMTCVDPVWERRRKEFYKIKKAKK